MKQLTIAVDFDGTIVKDRYPEIGPFRFGAIQILKWLKRRGHILILNTCRTDPFYTPPYSPGKYPLLEAALFLDKIGIKFHCLNQNIPERIKQYGSDCRKISADLYLDDKAFFPGWLVVSFVVLWMERKTRGGAA
jgi:hypothetical protein